MSTDVKPVHISNALIPILVTVLGMDTDVICVLLKNASVPILVYPSIITIVASPRFVAVTIAWVNSPEPVNVTGGGRTVLTPALPKKVMLVSGCTVIPRADAVAADIVTVVNPDPENA